MGVAPVLPRSTWEGLVETWRELDVPEGWRAEVIGEGIVVTPPPGYGHNLIADLVHRALVQATPKNLAIFQTAGTAIPLRSSLFVPDLVVVNRSDVPSEDAPGPMPAEKALLVVEITSKGNAETDRKTKLWSYAHAGVPLYLLIDRFAEGGPEVALHSDPADGLYRETTRAPFGEPVWVPKPFDLELETTEF